MIVVFVRDIEKGGGGILTLVFCCRQHIALLFPRGEALVYVVVLAFGNEQVVVGMYWHNVVLDNGAGE